MTMDDDALRAALASCGDGVTLRVKVVPGASRTSLVGLLRDRLKVAVAAPPEAGQANKAVCELLAELFNVPARDVRIAAGATQPRKTVELLGISLCAAAERLGTLLRK